MRLTEAIAYLAFRLLGPILACLAATGARADVALEVQPAELSAEVGVTEHVALVAKGERLDRPELSIIAPEGLRARIVRAPSPSMRGTLSWIVALTPDRPLTSESAILFRLSHGRGAQAREAIASAKLVPRAAPSVASQLTATVTLEDETVLDGQTTRALVTLTNLGDSPLRVRPELTGPAFLHIQGRAGHILLPARSSEVVEIRIGVKADVDHPLISGRHPLVLRVEANRPDAVRAWSGVLVATHPITVGVPGIAEVQSLVGVPSFLVLPGFLMVTTFLMLMRVFRPATKAEERESALAVALNPGLWVIAISLSAATIFLYPLVTGLVGTSRNILFGFDLSDVLRIWIACVFAGPVGALLYLWGSRRWHSWRQRNAFDADDQPLELLRKLQAQGRQSRLPYVDPPDGGRLFRLEPFSASDKVWAAPPIRLEFSPSADPGFDPKALVNIVRNGMIDDILAALAAAENDGVLRLEWAKENPIRQPALVARSLFAVEHAEPRSIIG